MRSTSVNTNKYAFQPCWIASESDVSDLFFLRLKSVYCNSWLVSVLLYVRKSAKEENLALIFREFLCTTNCSLIRVDLMSLSAVCVIARERCRG